MNLVPHRQQRRVHRCDMNRPKAKEIRDKDTHLNLQQQLMEHIWRAREDFEDEDKD